MKFFLLLFIIVNVHCSENGFGRCMAITAGRDFVVMRQSDGVIRSWGANFYGQLGFGFSYQTNMSTPAFFDVNQSRTLDLGEEVVNSVSCGETHCCAITEPNIQSGTVNRLFCWGYGWFGKLGYGDDQKSHFDASGGPVPLNSLPAPAMIMQVAVGYYHSCVILYAGNVRCFGSGGSGRLGYGNNHPVGITDTPDEVGDVPIGTAVAAICAGKHHTAVITANGDVMAWGKNEFGEAGYGHTNRIGNNATNTPILTGRVNLTTSNDRAEMISCRYHHTVVLLSSGLVVSFGLGESGQLGYGTTENVGDDEEPASVGAVYFGGDPCAAVTAGNHHTCCLKKHGRVSCVGNVDEGKIGVEGYTENVLAPNMTVNGTANDILWGVVDVVAGAKGSFTCVAKKLGFMKCWGSNVGAALGYDLDQGNYVANAPAAPNLPLPVNASSPFFPFCKISAPTRLPTVTPTASPTASPSPPHQPTMPFATFVTSSPTAIPSTKQPTPGTIDVFTGSEDSSPTENLTLPLAIGAAVCVLCVFLLGGIGYALCRRNTSRAAPSSDSMRSRSSSISSARKRYSHSRNSRRHYTNSPIMIGGSTQSAPLSEYGNFSNLPAAATSSQLYQSVPVAGTFMGGGNSAGSSQYYGALEIAGESGHPFGYQPLNTLD